MRPINPPNAEKKWESVAEKMKHREGEINRLVETKKEKLIEYGFKFHNLHSLVAIGYAMALEDNGLKDW